MPKIVKTGDVTESGYDLNEKIPAIVEICRFCGNSGRLDDICETERGESAVCPFFEPEN